jgi:uncharacterized RDD family membrane protein YckC
MFCKNCGTNMEDGAQFCPKCGTPVGTSSSSAVTNQSSLSTPLVLFPVSSGKRFANFILDLIFVYAFEFMIGFILGVVAVIIGKYDQLIIVLNTSSVSTGIGIASWVAYFLILEGFWGRTLGKLITKTKVVMPDGSKPDFIHILGRTFARIIPFEPLSFLFNPSGWHDSLSRTMVVPVASQPDIPHASIPNNPNT